jgi:hypothetical protein
VYTYPWKVFRILSFLHRPTALDLFFWRPAKRHQYYRREPAGGNKVFFPRVILPLSAVLSGLLDLGISFVMFIVLMVYYRIHFAWTILRMLVFLSLAVAAQSWA